MVHVNREILKRSFIYTMVMGVLTSIHHIYGGIIYNTSWRIHGVAGAGVLLLLTVLSYQKMTRDNKRASLWMYLALSTVVFGLIVGVYEGMYNHILKNVLYFGGLDYSLWVRVFPAPTYEAPSNWFFELTGVIQGFLGSIILYSNCKAGIRLHRD